MKANSIFIFVLLTACAVSFLSCSDKDDEKEVFYPHELIVGETTNVEVFSENYSIYSSFEDKDSLDLDHNGSFDIVFKPVPVSQTSGYSSVNCIFPSGQLQLVVSESSNVKLMDEGDLISLDTNWSVKQSEPLLWLDTNELIDYFQSKVEMGESLDFYLGFLLDGTRLGWIKLEVENFEQLIIREVGLVREQ